MSAQGVSPDHPGLKPVEIHDILSNERRQLILQFLQAASGSMTAQELAERIAEAETGTAPPPRNIRQSAYVSLHQTHLPKLDELGVIEYDHIEKTVRLSDRAAEVRFYMESVPKYGLSWSEYYIVVSALGLLLIVASEIGVPVIADIGALTLSAVVLVLIAASGVYQMVSQRSSLIHRVQD